MIDCIHLFTFGREFERWDALQPFQTCYSPGFTCSHFSQQYQWLFVMVMKRGDLPLFFVSLMMLIPPPRVHWFNSFLFIALARFFCNADPDYVSNSYSSPIIPYRLGLFYTTRDNQLECLVTPRCQLQKPSFLYICRSAGQDVNFTPEVQSRRDFTLNT